VATRFRQDANRFWAIAPDESSCRLDATRGLPEERGHGDLVDLLGPQRTDTLDVFFADGDGEQVEFELLLVAEDLGDDRKPPRQKSRPGLAIDRPDEELFLASDRYQKASPLFFNLDHVMPS
jgi:hypothetical protein